MTKVPERLNRSFALIKQKKTDAGSLAGRFNALTMLRAHFQLLVAAKA